MAGASVRAICGLAAGLLAGGWLGLGPAIGAVGQSLIGGYEAVAPALIFAILGPSLLKLLRQGYAEGAAASSPSRFALYAIYWFSGLRATVCIATALAVSAVYRLPLLGTDWHLPDWQTLSGLVQNRYLATLAGAGLTAWLLRRRDGPGIALFLSLPARIEAAGSLLTRFTPLFGFVVGVYIASLPDMLTTAIGRMHGPPLHAVAFRWFEIDTAAPGGPMAAYLTVTGLTALLCIALHAVLVALVRLRLPDFSVSRYLTDYLLRVYPPIWSTGAESLAIPANLAMLRRYGGNAPDAMRDLTSGLAATLNLNGTPICCLVLLPAICMAIGHPLSILELFGCLPAIFILCYAIPGIPGELAIFAAPIAQMLGLSGGERDLFLLLFLSWQIGLTDSFRSAGSATDAVPATLLILHGYRGRLG